MELFFAVIGTLQTIWSYLAEKIANIGFGTNMEDNSIIQIHMTMSSLVSSGHQTVITLLSDLSRCLDYVIEQDGHTLLINQPVVQSWISHGVMMELLLQELEEMDKLSSEIL